VKLIELVNVAIQELIQVLCLWFQKRSKFEGKELEELLVQNIPLTQISNRAGILSY